MQARKITLIEIGAGPLPSVTPVPQRESSWFPIAYVSPDVPPVEGVVPNPVADGVLIEWDAVDQEGVIYIIERGPTAQGPWTEIARVVETRYLYSDGSGQEWWFKITASVRGKAGEGSIIPVKPPPTAQEIIDLIEEQNRLGQEMAGGFAEQAQQIANLGAALNAAVYDPEMAYNPGAVVKWEGGLYYALVETKGNLPSDAAFWKKIGDYSSLAEALGAQGLQLTNHSVRIEQTETGLAVISERVDGVAASLDGKANSSALDALSGRVGETETGVAANSEAIRQANAEIAGKASTAALSALSGDVRQQGEQITATAAGLDNVRADLSGGGGNLIPNSGFEQDLSGWTLVSDQWGAGGIVRDGSADWIPAGMHAFTIYGAGTPASSTTAIAASRTSPAVVVGKRYALSVWSASHRCLGSVALVFTDENFNVISIVNSDNNGGAGGGQDLNGWRRVVAVGVAPPGARLASLWFVGSGPSGATPVAWFLRPQFEEMASGQQQPSKWQEGAAGLDSKYAQVTQAIEARTTINENGIAEYRASWTMSLDANGRVAGIRSVNNGTTSTIDFLFDRVRFVSPGNGRRMEYSDGHFTGYDENNKRRIRLGTWSS
ncbi:hypothetical protein JAK28_05910 [Stenotrophomonas maltophilia]|nr:hypothetical protein [Stenotrophomonas maltophilia]